MAICDFNSPLFLCRHHVVNSQGKVPTPAELVKVADTARPWEWREWAGAGKTGKFLEKPIPPDKYDRVAVKRAERMRCRPPDQDEVAELVNIFHLKEDKKKGKKAPTIDQYGNIIDADSGEPPAPAPEPDSGDESEHGGAMAEAPAAAAEDAPAPRSSMIADALVSAPLAPPVEEPPPDDDEAEFGRGSLDDVLANGDGAEWDAAEEGGGEGKGEWGDEAG